MKNLVGLLRNKKVLLVIVILIAAVAAGGGFYIYQKNKAKVANPVAVAEIKDLTSKVGKLIELPLGETPTVATVSDITKLKDQPFFAGARNGDKVLVYQKAKKAILYRPSDNKIIEVAVYNPPSASTTIPSPTQATKKVKVVLYNGTTIVGYTKTTQADLEGKVANIEITDRQNAAKSDYKKTIVVDLGNNTKVAQEIANALEAEVGDLPEGETRPENADILVILGSSQ